MIALDLRSGVERLGDMIAEARTIVADDASQTEHYLYHGSHEIGADCPDGAGSGQG